VLEATDGVPRPERTSVAGTVELGVVELLRVARIQRAESTSIRSESAGRSPLTSRAARNERGTTEEGTSAGERCHRGMQPSSMPSIAWPFTAFGAAAGFFAILALGWLGEPARTVSPFLPMAVTAAAGGFLARALRGWSRLHEPAVPREIVVFWTALLTAIAGAVSGAAVGFYMWGIDGVARFALGGSGAALFFTPSCLVVFDAAKRAGRGRHGSLVADTDRRTVRSTIFAGIAFAGATQVPALLATRASTHLSLLVQASLSLVVCFGAAAAIVALQRRDRAARAVLDGFARDAAWLDRAETEASEEGAVDLGLGDDRWTRANDASYRTSGRAGVLLTGSVEDARSAFDEGARRRHRSLLIATCSLTAVAVATALRLSVLS